MVVFLAALNVAQADDVVQGANALGMGRTGAANAHDNASITLNPGQLGLVERYDFHAHMRFGPTGGFQWGVTALDARTSKRFAAGFAYSGDRFNGPLRQNDLPGWSLPGEELENRRRQDDFTLSVGVPFLGRRASIGTGVLFSRFNHDRDGRGSTADVHVGIGIRPVDWLSAGFSVRNLAPIDSAQDRPLSYVGGLRLMARDDNGVERFALEANVTSTDDPFAVSPLSYGVGGKAGFGTLRLRGGVYRDGIFGRTQLTTGLGIETAKGGGFDYALLIPVAGQELRGNTLVHQIAFRFGAPEDILEEDR